MRTATGLRGWRLSPLVYFLGGGGYCGFCSCGYKKFAITWR